MLDAVRLALGTLSGAACLSPDAAWTAAAPGRAMVLAPLVGLLLGALALLVPWALGGARLFTLADDATVLTSASTEAPPSPARIEALAASVHPAVPGLLGAVLVVAALAVLDPCTAPRRVGRHRGRARLGPEGRRGARGDAAQRHRAVRRGDAAPGAAGAGGGGPSSCSRSPFGVFALLCRRGGQPRDAAAALLRRDHARRSAGPGRHRRRLGLPGGPRGLPAPRRGSPSRRPGSWPTSWTRSSPEEVRPGWGSRRCSRPRGCT